MKRLFQVRLLVAIFVSITFIVGLLASFSSIQSVEAQEKNVNSLNDQTDFISVTAFSVITFGETLPGTISPATQVDTYTFIANSGDVVLVAISRVSNNLQPKIELYDPDNNFLIGNMHPVHAEITQVLTVTNSSSPTNFQVYLPIILHNQPSTLANTNSSNIFFVTNISSATFTVLVSDGSATNTGGYNLYLQRLNNPGNPIAFSFGQVTSDAISLLAEMDSYTFNGTQNDQIRIRMVDTDPTFYDPEFRVYRPDGSFLCSASQGLIADEICVLDVDGKHLILTADGSGDETGNYGLTIRRTNNLSNPTSINFGEALTETVSPSVELDAYTFDGTSGDKIRIRMTDIDPTLYDPQFWLYRPDGTLLCSFGQGQIADEICILDTNGTHSLLAGDVNGDETGNYGLAIQRTNNPFNTTSMSYGDIITTSISPPTELDAYTFNGTTGDQVRFTMIDVDPTFFDPQFWVYRPDGSLLCSAGQGLIAQEDCTLDSSGTYLILTGDVDGEEVGNYQLGIQKL